MTCAPIEAPPQSLAAAIERAHCWSDHALSQPEPDALAGVWWMSTHLAAVARVVYPVADRLLPDARADIARQRRRSASLNRQLWALEHAVTGDARVGPSSAHLLADVAAAVRDHAASDADLIERLASVLAHESLDALQRRYADAVRHAPSRPHPVASRSRILAAVGFRALGTVDAVRDTLDSRHVPRQVRG